MAAHFNDFETVTPYLVAVGNGSNLSRVCLAQHSTQEQGDAFGASALHLAAQSGDVDTIKQLLASERAALASTPAPAGSARGTIPGSDGGACHDTSTPVFTQLSSLDRYNCTPLHYAANNKQVEAARVLIAAGANITAMSSTGCMPLHYAAASGSEEMISLVMSHGAPVISTDRDGWTALHYAVSKASPAGVELLVAAGAVVNARDTIARTALQAAVTKGRADIADVLLKCGAEGCVRFDFIPEGTVEAVRAVLKAGLEVDAQSGRINCTSYGKQRVGTHSSHLCWPRELTYAI
jgi:ankyrin repeat protein